VLRGRRRHPQSCARSHERSRPPLPHAPGHQAHISPRRESHPGKLVATLHEDSVLERMGLEDRLSDVTAELASLEAAPGRAAESELVFYGAPVRGSAGIDARFTSAVISAYQDLIAKWA
jgi:hypothetical protein